VNAPATHSVECPFPEVDGISVEGRELGPDVFGIGNIQWHPEMARWQCLANVNGCLCLIELRVHRDKTIEYGVAAERGAHT
jgi:hypothetical protein